jgi:hypothetical protein
MAKTLTDTAIRMAKPKDIPYKLFDGDGLFLLVTPLKTGKLPPKWWGEVVAIQISLWG